MRMRMPLQSFPHRGEVGDSDNRWQTGSTFRHQSQRQRVMGDTQRHTTSLNDFEVVINPVGPDGYPVPLWDKTTGKMNREVARYVREHGYDLREHIQHNWSKIGRDLKGKLRQSQQRRECAKRARRVPKMEQFW